MGSSSESSNKKLNLLSIIKTRKKGVESTVISREGSLREPSNSNVLCHITNER